MWLAVCRLKPHALARELINHRKDADAPPIAQLHLEGFRPLPVKILFTVSPCQRAPRRGVISSAFKAAAMRCTGECR